MPTIQIIKSYHSHSSFLEGDLVEIDDEDDLFQDGILLKNKQFIPNKYFKAPRNWERIPANYVWLKNNKYFVQLLN